MHKYIDTKTIEEIEYGVRLMDNKDSNDIDAFFKLFHACFGKRSHLDKEWFDWYYNNNPLGVCNNYLLFDLSKKVLVGAYGFSKIGYNYQLVKKVGVLGVNGMILENYTKKGLYAYLMDIGLEKETKNNLAFSFPHGYNIGSVKGHFKSNWDLLEDLYFYKKDISKPIVDKPKSSVKIINTIELKNIKFKEFDGNQAFSFCRSFEHIKWRYIDRPHKDYTIIGNYISENEIDSYMILGKYQDKNREIRCQIIDFRFKKTGTLESLICLAEIVAQAINAKTIDLIISEKSIFVDTLVKSDFLKTDELYKLMVYSDIKTSFASNALLGDFDAV